MTKADFYAALGVFGVLDTLFLGLTCNDACRQFVKTYPGFTLALMATLLSLLAALTSVSIRLSRRLRRKPVPAIEIIQADPGRFLP